MIKNQLITKALYPLTFFLVFMLVFSCILKKETKTFSVSVDGPFHVKFKLDDRYYNGVFEWTYFQHEFENFEQYMLKTTCRSFRSKKNKGDSRIRGNIRFMFDQDVVFENEMYFELSDKNQLIINLYVNDEYLPIGTSKENTGYLKINLVNKEDGIYKGEFSAQLEENELGIKEVTEGELEFIIKP